MIKINELGAEFSLLSIPVVARGYYAGHDISRAILQLDAGNRLQLFH
jgi:hypothetical protein